MVGENFGRLKIQTGKKSLVKSLKSNLGHFLSTKIKFFMVKIQRSKINDRLKQSQQKNIRNETGF